MEGSWLMANISSDAKVAYLFDGTNWRPIAGAGTVNPSADYQWTGDHTYSSESVVTFETVVKNKAGINNFANPAARDLALSSPVTGLVAFVAQSEDGSTINDIQFYDGTRWRSSNDSAILVSPSIVANAYTLVPADAGNSLKITDATDTIIYIPENASNSFKIGQKIEVLRLGTGNVSIAPLTGAVTLNSKNGNRKIASQYSGAVLTKIDTNSWLLIGDLTA
jgi:hypothetical protein